MYLNKIPQKLMIRPDINLRRPHQISFLDTYISISPYVRHAGKVSSSLLPTGRQSTTVCCEDTRGHLAKMCSKLFSKRAECALEPHHPGTINVLWANAASLTYIKYARQ